MEPDVGDHRDAYDEEVYKFIAHPHGPQDVCVEGGSRKVDVGFYGWARAH
jgi:hypothetical protein